MSMQPQASFAGAYVLLRRADGTELVLSRAEAIAVAGAVSPSADAAKAVKDHINDRARSLGLELVR